MKGGRNERQSLPVRARTRAEHLARTPSLSDGGTQPACRHRGDRRRRHDEGARQDDFGRRHYRPVWCATHRPSTKRRRKDRTFRPAAGDAECRMRTTTGDSCRRLKKTDPNHDRRSPPPSDGRQAAPISHWRNGASDAAVRRRWPEPAPLQGRQQNQSSPPRGGRKRKPTEDEERPTSFHGKLASLAKAPGGRPALLPGNRG